jgi:hypothetical protein
MPTTEFDRMASPGPWRQWGPYLSDRQWGTVREDYSSNGDAKFINLQKRDREKVQQAAEAAFPDEFRESIKQYNMNIKEKPKVAEEKK